VVPYASGIGLQALAVAVIFVAVNFLARVRELHAPGFFAFARISSSPRRHARVIREFQKPLSIVVISSPTMFGPATQVLGDVRNLLNEVRYFGRERGVDRIRRSDPQSGAHARTPGEIQIRQCGQPDHSRLRWAHAGL